MQSFGEGFSGPKVGTFKNREDYISIQQRTGTKLKLGPAAPCTLIGMCHECLYLARFSAVDYSILLAPMTEYYVKPATGF